MRSDAGYRDGEPFIAKLEAAQAEGNTDFVAAHMPRLERLIARYMDRTHELASALTGHRGGEAQGSGTTQGKNGNATG